MAIAYVQATSAQSSSATSITTPSLTTTAGNCVVASASCNNASAIGTSAITDSKSNTYTRIYATASGATKGAGFYALNIAGGSSHTFTFTPPSTCACAVGVAEFSGVLTASALDQSASAGSGSTVVHSSGAAGTTSQADELLVGFGTSNSGTSAPVGDPAFTDVIFLTDSSPEGVIVSYRIVSATGAYNYAFTNALTTAEGVGIATFKGSAIAYVQAVSVQSSGATSITTPSFTSTAGNALVAGVGAGATIPASPMSDNKSSTWANAWTDNAATSAKGACFYALNIPGGSGQTVTYTPTASTFCALGVTEFSGIDTSSALDKTANAHATASPHDSGSTATTSQAAELLVGVGSISHGTAIPFSTVASPTWTDVVALADGAPEGVLLSYRIVSAVAAYSFTYNVGGVSLAASVGVAGIATFKAVLPGVGDVTLAPMAAAGTGTVTITGTGAVTMPSAAVQGTDAVTITGSGGVTLPAASAAATGTESIPGAGAVTLRAASVDVVGAVLNPSAVALPALSISGTGDVQAPIFPDAPASTTIRLSLIDLDDDERKIGKLLALGSIENELSDSQGNLTAATLDVKGSDLSDRAIGAMLEDDSLKFFQRDEVSLFVRSDVGRRSTPVATPRRLARVLLQRDSYGSPVEFEFSGIDPLFCDGGAFGPDRTFPLWQYPSYYGNAPQDVFAKYMPVILGEVSDEGAVDPVTGASAARGKCPLTFVGYDGLPTGTNGATEVWGRLNLCLYAVYDIVALYGSDLGGGIYGIGSAGTGASSDGGTPSVLTLETTLDLSRVLTDGTESITLFTARGVTKSKITAIDNVSKLVTIDNTIDQVDAIDVDWIIGEDVGNRVSIDIASRQGVDVMVPHWAGYVRSTPYEDISGSDGEQRRVTDIWVRGPLLDEHLAGTITLAANVIGVEDEGDGTGLPITDYFTAYYFWLINCVLAQTAVPGGTGFVGKWPQTDGDIAAVGGSWADGIYKVRGSSFTELQTRSAAELGDHRGYQVSAYFDQPMSTTEAVALWNNNGGCRSGISEHGDIFVWSVDPDADTSTWTRIEHVSRIFGSVRQSRPQNEIENVVRGQCDWDPAGGVYRNGLVRLKSAMGIQHNKGIVKQSPILEGRLVADQAQWASMLTRRLNYGQDGPVYVEITGDFGLVDLHVGDGILLTSIMGPGALGYVDQPCYILKKRLAIDSRLVTLTLLNVGPGSGMGLVAGVDQEPGDVPAVVVTGTGTGPGGVVVPGKVAINYTLTNDQIKALPTDGYELVAALGANARHKFFGATLHIISSAGAYTNIDPDAYLVIAVADEAAVVSGYLANDPGMSPALTLLSDALGGVDALVEVQPSSPVPDALFSATWGTLPSFRTAPVPDIDDQPLRLIVNNQGAGNFTGGNASNTAYITVYYEQEVLYATLPVDAATLSIAWDANTEPDLEGYLLEWGTESGVYTFSRDVGNVLAYVLTGLVNGGTYYVSIEAYNATGYSPDAPEVSGVASL